MLFKNIILISSANMKTGWITLILTFEHVLTSTCLKITGKA